MADPIEELILADPERRKALIQQSTDQAMKEQGLPTRADLVPQQRAPELPDTAPPAPPIVNKTSQYGTVVPTAGLFWDLVGAPEVADAVREVPTPDGLLAGLYYNATGQERGWDEAVASHYNQRFSDRLGAEDNLAKIRTYQDGALDHGDFLRAARDAYMRREAYRHHGTTDMTRIPDAEYQVYLQKAHEFADRELQSALASGALFATPKPDDFDWFSSRLDGIGTEQARSAGNAVVRAAMRSPTSPTAWVSNQALSMLLDGAQALPLPDEAQEALKVREEAYTQGVESWLPAQVVDDPLGYSALVLDTATAAITPWGRRTMGGDQFQFARPEMGGQGTASMILRPLSTLPTTMAAMLAYHRTDVDPRYWAAQDRMVTEEFYSRGKGAGEEIWGEGHWAAGALGYMAGAGGLVGDVFVPGGPLEAGLMGAGKAAKAFNAAKVIPGEGAMGTLMGEAMWRAMEETGATPTSWALENLATAMEASGGEDIVKSLDLAAQAERQLGPAVAGGIERSFAQAAIGTQGENLSLLRNNMADELDEARKRYNTLKLNVERTERPTEAMVEQAEQARKAFLQAEAEYNSVSEALAVLRNVDAAPSQIGTTTNLRQAKRNLLEARDNLTKWGPDDVVKAVRASGGKDFVPPRVSAWKTAMDTAEDAGKQHKKAFSRAQYEAGLLVKRMEEYATSEAVERRLSGAVSSTQKKLAEWGKKAGAPGAAHNISRYAARKDVLKKVVQGLPVTESELAALTKAQRKLIERQAEAPVVEGLANALRVFAETGEFVNVSNFLDKGGMAGWGATRFTEIQTKAQAAMNAAENARKGAMADVTAAQAQLMQLRDAQLAHVTARLADLDKVSKQLAQRYRDLAQAYRASRGSMRPPEELLGHLVKTTQARTREEAEDLLLGLEDIMRAAADPQAWKLGIRGMRGWATRTKARFKQAVDPIVERHGNLDPKVQHAMVVTENIYRASQSDVLTLLVTNGRKHEEKIRVLDKYMSSTEGVAYGGKFKGANIVGLRWTQRLHSDLKQGVTLTNKVKLGGETYAPWDVVRMKFGQADSELGLGELVEQNPDLRGLAFMWVGGKQVNKDAEASLIGQAMAMLKREEPISAADFREEMRQATLRLGVQPDNKPYMVAYRQAVATGWTASTMRGMELIEAATGEAAVATRVKDLRALASGDFYKASDISGAEQFGARFGMPVLPKGNVNPDTPADPEFMKAMGNVTKDQPHWVSAQTAKRWASYADDFVKATDRYTPSGVRSFGTLFYNLWKRSVVAGLAAYDPGYGFQNVLGDQGQMTIEQGLIKATQRSFANLSTNIPLVNRWLSWRAANAYDATKGQGALPGIFDTLFNAKTKAVLYGKQGEIVVDGGKRKGQRISFDDARRYMVEEGVLSTFESAEGLADLVRGDESGIWARVKSWSDAIGTHADVVAKNQRAALFLEELQRHGDVRRAGQMVNRALYDYANFVTDAERRSIGVISPFWSFWKNSMAQQLRAITDLYEDPSLGRLVNGQFVNVKKMEALKRLLVNAATPDEETEYQNAWVSEWMANRAKWGFDKLEEKEAEFYLRSLGRKVDTTVHILPPDGYQDTLELLMAPMALMTGLVYEADKARSGGVSNLPYTMGAGWERYAIEPVSSLLGPLVSPFVLSWAEAMGLESGAYGVSEYSRVHPALISVENATSYEWFTDTDQDGKIKMKTWAAALMRNTPVLNEYLLMSKNMWFENAGRAAEGSAMHQYLQVLRYGTQGALRVQPRLYSTELEHQRYMDEITRELQERKKILDGANRWEARPQP